MKYIDLYENYHINEHSKNDPIPELTYNKPEKLAIFLFGIPGVGKSSFTREKIQPKLRSFKVFNPDDIMIYMKKLGHQMRVYSPEEVDRKIEHFKSIIKYIDKKYNIHINLKDDEILKIIDSNRFIPATYDILQKTLMSYMHSDSASDLIYDTTGNDYNRIKSYTSRAKQNGYKILYIRLITELETAIKRNLERERTVELPYQVVSYEKSIGGDQKFMDLKPDAFYLYDTGTNEYYKYIDDELAKRKGSKYIKQ